MYGMVNKALESMVRHDHGEAVWDAIREKAGVDIEMFLSNEGYPDEVTYGLVGAASEVLRESPEEILKAFGRYWVLETARHGYGDMMTAAGRTLREFLINLPDFHTRVILIFPHLKPPHFYCTDIGETSLLLHYQSGRAGLEPFVVGLIEGLGEMFATPVRIEPRSDPADRAVFAVSWNG